MISKLRADRTANGALISHRGTRPAERVPRDRVNTLGRDAHGLEVREDVEASEEAAVGPGAGGSFPHDD